MAEEITEDAFFDGGLTLRQPRRGHRIGSDAVLLAAACPPVSGTICDIGAGVGAVGLRIAQVNTAARVDLAEIDPALHALAVENIGLNGLEARASAHCVDILSRPFGVGDAGPPPTSFDIVVSNPPFLDAGKVRLSPDATRRRAHVSSASLEHWVKACLSRLRAKGHLVLIHRADALGELLDATRGRLGGLVLRFVQPRADQPAHRLLLRGRRGSRAPLTVLPPLVLHGADGRFTAEAEAIHRGAATIDWGLPDLPGQQTR